MDVRERLSGLVREYYALGGAAAEANEPALTRPEVDALLKGELQPTTARAVRLTAQRIALAQLGANIAFGRDGLGSALAGIDAAIARTFERSLGSSPAYVTRERARAALDNGAITASALEAALQGMHVQALREGDFTRAAALATRMTGFFSPATEAVREAVAVGLEQATLVPSQLGMLEAMRSFGIVEGADFARAMKRAYLHAMAEAPLCADDAKAEYQRRLARFDDQVDQLFEVTPEEQNAAKTRAARAIDWTNSRSPVRIAGQVRLLASLGYDGAAHEALVSACRTGAFRLAASTTPALVDVLRSEVAKRFEAITLREDATCAITEGVEEGLRNLRETLAKGDYASGALERIAYHVAEEHIDANEARMLLTDWVHGNELEPWTTVTAKAAHCAAVLGVAWDEPTRRVIFEGKSVLAGLKSAAHDFDTPDYHHLCGGLVRHLPKEIRDRRQLADLLTEYFNAGDPTSFDEHNPAQVRGPDAPTYQLFVDGLARALTSVIGVTVDPHRGKDERRPWTVRLGD